MKLRIAIKVFRCQGNCRHKWTTILEAVRIVKRRRADLYDEVMAAMNNRVFTISDPNELMTKNVEEF